MAAFHVLMKTPLALGLALSIVTACGRHTDAERVPQQNEAPQPPQPAVAVKPPPAPLEDSATRLPEGFVADDIERVIESLRAAEKSEFETTEAYRKRLVEEANAAIYNFIVDPMETTYDADRGQMVVRLWLKVDPSTTDIYEDSLMVPVRNKVERSTFPASNAFGVQLQVQRTTETAHGLAAAKVPAAMIGQRVPAAMYERYERFFDVRVPMPPDEARQRKGSLRFLLRTRSATHTKVRTREGSYEWKATINSPTSRVTQSYAAYIGVYGLAIWVVDSSTGDILAKTSLADLLKLKRRVGTKG